MVYNLLQKDYDSIALVDDCGYSLTYKELNDFCSSFYSFINKRTLIFLLVDNSVGGAAGYFSAIENKIVALMLDPDMDTVLLEELIKEYSPEYLWVPKRKIDQFKYRIIGEMLNFLLLKTDLESPLMSADLSLLLSTSGSTGSPKLVRHSYNNIIANASNVSISFQISKNDRAMASLPLYFTQGLSVLSSYIYSGATVILTNYALTQKEFWEFFKEQKVSIFTGVPYSYEILRKIRFFRMSLPDLNVLSQGGGRLSDDLFQQITEYASKNGKKFVATYGATETTSRMAFLSADMSSKKCGSIGKSIANGKITLIDDNGLEIRTSNVIGEVVYQGENVTLGYAECKEDLQKDDERNGIYYTGDLAKYDEEGYIYIVGRKKRFLKLYGYRVSLDEMERMIKNEFRCECACVGTDKKMRIYITDQSLSEKILTYVYEKTKIHLSAFEVIYLDLIPKNSTGKILYANLEVE